MSIGTRHLVTEIDINWGTGTDADTSPYNDVTPDKSSVSISWGRDQARATAPGKTETFSCILNNMHGTYSNAAGPLAGYVNRGPRIVATINHDSEVTVDSLDVTLDDENWTVDDPISYQVFGGSIDQAPQSLDTIKTVAIQGLGAMKYFNKKRISLPLMENVRVDEILHAICDKVGFPEEKRFFDEGDLIIQQFWLADEYPISKMFLLASTEGPGAVLFTNNKEELHFQGNQYRFNNPRSLEPQWYLYDRAEATAPIKVPIMHSPPTVLNQSPQEVYNVVNGEVNYRQLSNLGQKWSYGSSLSLFGGEVRTIYTSLSVPVKEAEIPQVGTDYQLQSGSIVSISLEETSGTRIGITITAGGSGAVIIGPSGQESDGIYLRARSLDVLYTTQLNVTVDVQDSIDRYGENEYPLAIWPEINHNELQDRINAIARRYREPRDQLTINVYNVDLYHALFILTCQVSDRIHIVSTHQGINSDFYIENIKLTDLGNGTVYLTLGCELAVDQEAFRIGVDTFGGNVFG